MQTEGTDTTGQPFGDRLADAMRPSPAEAAEPFVLGHGFSVPVKDGADCVKLQIYYGALRLGIIGGTNRWVRLSPDQARQIADGLTEAADIATQYADAFDREARFEGHRGVHPLRDS
jgi:hypothetical protein